MTKEKSEIAKIIMWILGIIAVSTIVALIIWLIVQSKTA